MWQSPAGCSYIPHMRHLLAILALVGLLLSPVAASAATQVCLHHDGGAGMSMPMADGALAKAGAPDCCDDHGNPAKHDDHGCAQACAVMAGVTAALPQAEPGAALSMSHTRIAPAALMPLQAHGPPGLKRPPKHEA